MFSTKNFLTINIAVLLSLINDSQQWWNNGHLIVARIAYDLLEDSVKDRAEQALSHLSGYTTLERDHKFVECATFADSIKGAGWSDQADWHFIDTPFFDEGFDTDIWIMNENITWAIGEILHGFQRNSNSMTDNERGHQASPNEQVSNGGYVSWDLADSFNLRLLVHYVGDVHQPLHASSRYTSQYPNGDKGGNMFHLQSQYGISNLHALWDSVLYNQTDDFSLPLSEDNWNKLGNIAKSWTELYPKNSFPDWQANYNKWDEETFQLVENFVYKNITEDQIPSDEYLEEGKKLAISQLVKAGYRLSKLLNDFWGTQSNSIQTEELNNDIDRSIYEIEQQIQDQVKEDVEHIGKESFIEEVKDVNLFLQ